MFWPKTLNSYSSILELRDDAKLSRISKPVNEIRSSVKIAIIDDEKFRPLPNLTSYGYRITELPDIKSILETKEYDIVFCDLMGVGNNFDQSLGGASIIKEIKKNYPSKGVIAYTGSRANTSEAIAARKFADDFVKKDAEISQWVETLDRAINIAIDPYHRWIAARQGLMDIDVDIRRIVELESSYVDALKAKDPHFTKLNELARKAEIGGHARGIVQGLISSAIYSLIFS